MFSPLSSRQVFLTVGLVLLLPLTVLPLSPDGDFTGKVVDAETNKPIPDVVVRIENLDLTEKTSATGEFVLTRLKGGTYTLRFLHVGYQEVYKTIRISDSTNLNYIVLLTPRIFNLNEVVVTSEHSHDRFEDLADETQVLKGMELQKDLGLTLASTLKNETGIAIRSMGPAPARPVIRGLGSDRVTLSEDGNKSTDLSGTSPDHAVTVEPFSIERVEVIRGPRSLMYNSTTIGGVINMVRHEIPQEKLLDFSGIAGGYFESASLGVLGSLVTSFPLSGLNFRTEYTAKKAGNEMTPAGRLKNSESDNQSWSLGTSWVTETGFIGASYRDYQLTYGIPGGFIGAHPNGVSIEMSKQTANLKSRFSTPLKGLETIQFHVTANDYRHKEFESDGSLGADFLIRNVNGSLQASHDHSFLFDRGNFGVSFDIRDFKIGGNVYTPSSQSGNLSAFVYEARSAGNWSFEGAFRSNLDRIQPDKEKSDSRIGNIRVREFITWAFSLSALYQVNSDLSAGANLSKSSRVPTIEELFSEGPHLAAYSYEIGNPELKDESGLGSELFLYFKTESLSFLLTGFYNRLTHFILPKNTGEIDWRLILPKYQMLGVNAEFYGFESELKLDLTDNLKFQSSISQTIGKETGSGKNLPSIPPVKGQTSAIWTEDELEAGLTADYAFRQDRVDEFEEPTNGYLVWNSHLQKTLTVGNSVTVFSLSADNLLNTEYRNHLSRIKSILPETGRNFRLSVKYYF
ncbi:MAG: TonB-dependent receptor [Bacteroidetes bacterium]|nr:TonB-dependent receptor [Bacteroidota bacterium]